MGVLQSGYKVVTFQKNLLTFSSPYDIIYMSRDKKIKKVVFFMKKRNQFGKKITSVTRRDLIYDVDVVHISTSFPTERYFIVKVHHTKFGPRRYAYVSNNDFSELCSYHSYISKGDYEGIFLNGVFPHMGFLFFVDAVSINSYYVKGV